MFKYDCFFIFVSVYVLIMINLKDIKDKFYEDYDVIIFSVFKFNKFFVFGDFNVWVGYDYINWENIIGYYGIGSCNFNSLLLFKICVIYKLFNINRVYCLLLCNKIIWMYFVLSIGILLIILL